MFTIEIVSKIAQLDELRYYSSHDGLIDSESSGIQICICSTELATSVDSYNCQRVGKLVTSRSEGARAPENREVKKASNDSGMSVNREFDLSVMIMSKAMEKPQWCWQSSERQHSMFT